MYRHKDGIFTDDSFPWANLVTTRSAGDMRDPARRRSFCEQHGIDFGRLVTAQQVHGRTVALVDARRAGTEIPATDGLITADPSVPLAIFTADCVPVFLACAGAVGVVHAGWRGLAAGIIPEALRLLKEEFNAAGASVTAAIGPHIGACCYEVSADLLATFGLPAGERHLDLTAVAVRQLQAQGVTAVSVNGRCTAHEDLFFSYRATKTAQRIMSLAQKQLKTF